MTKLNVTELRKLSKSKVKVKDIEIEGLEVAVNQYLSIVDKISLADSCILSSADEGELVDKNLVEIAYKVFLVKFYTDIKLPKDNIEAYDLLVNSGVYDSVVEAIPVSESEELAQVMQNAITEHSDRVKASKTVESVLENGIESFKEVIQSFANDMPTAEELGEMTVGMKNELNELNPDNLKFITDFIKKADGSQVIK